MTKREIAELLGQTDVSYINKAFVKAEAVCISIKEKKSHYNKKQSVDYTWDEFLETIQFLDQTRVFITPAVLRYMRECWIERDTPHKYNELKNPVPRKANNFIKLYNEGKAPDVCINCIYFESRSRQGSVHRGSPYCTFYSCFINKVKVRRDIYSTRCETYRRSDRVPYIFTTIGPVKIDMIGKLNTTMAGIPQSEFISKRDKNEPITILRDVFAEDN